MDVMVNQPPPESHKHIAEYYLDLACCHLPVLANIIEKYRSFSLSEYVQTLVPKYGESFQQRDDLLDVIYTYVTPLLGESVALRTVHDLTSSPGVLTTNHHGVEFFSQTFQARLIWSLRSFLVRPVSTSTVIVFACGNVPLDNPTYPQGILLYDINSFDRNRIPIKLPIFSNKLRRWMVSTASAFDKTMISRAKVQVHKKLSHGKISSRAGNSLHRILLEDYENPSVIACSNYSQQAVIINNRIWKRLFLNIDRIPDLVYLELEKIVTELLKIDLLNPNSLAWRVMFDAVLREHVLNELDGARACWNRQKLAYRQKNSFHNTPQGMLEGCGTIFFWGVDHRMRRVPLFLDTTSSGEYILRGVNDRGNVWEIPYTSEAILYKLRENMLLPSLFTCFLVLSFARGLVCVGGYFQCEYLPVMQQGTVAALQKTPGYDNIARLVSQVPTNCYLNSMSVTMTNTADHGFLPAGPVEMIAGGGITNSDIEQMSALTVREAHLAGMFETVLDVVAPELYPSGWKKQLATDCSFLLNGKIVIK